MAKNIKKQVKQEKSFSYMQKDFDSFRNELTSYARRHYGDKIVDFSESSMAGLFLDMAAYIGDTLSFYLDHQYTETFLETANEPQNIAALIRSSGVEILGPSASTANVKISLIIPSIIDANTSNPIPNQTYMPVIKSGTIFGTQSGTEFSLLDDVDFRKKDINNVFIADYKVNSTTRTGEVLDFIVTMEGICTSAKTYTEKFPIGDRHIPFRTITLSKEDVTEIISVIDSDLDEYYQVKNLTQDTVYTRFENTNSDFELVPERINLIPAPKRYTLSRSSTTGKSTLKFGSGNSELFDEDIIPDPSEHAIKLYGDRKYFDSISIDPNSFLETQTLGISPRNTTLTIKYRHGGGLSDNVSAGQISFVVTLLTEFDENVSSFFVNKIR